MPEGASYDRDYYWSVWIYRGADAFGTAFYMRRVRFSQAAQPTPSSETVFMDDFCDEASGWPSTDTAQGIYGYWHESGQGCQGRAWLKQPDLSVWVTPGERL